MHGWGWIAVGLMLGCRSDDVPVEPVSGPTDTGTVDSSSDTAGSGTVPTGSTGTTTDTAPTDTGTVAPRVVAMLHGGGAASDVVFGRFVAAAGNGHIVTLGSVDADDPDRDGWDGYFVGLGAASARTINTTRPEEAEDPAVIADLATADGIFVRGGDQSRYLALWEGTALHDAWLQAIDDGAVVGGSSAGCAILGERVYDARRSSVAPYDVLDDARHPGITFTDGFLNVLPGVLTDTHFTERGRLGRLVVFQQHWREEGVEGLAIGVDPETALFVYDDGSAEVVGEGSVTLLDGRASTAVLPDGRPPDIRGVVGWQLPEGYVVDLEHLDAPVLSRPAYVAATGAPGMPSGWAPFRIDGYELAQRQLGSWWIPNLADDGLLWFDGQLELAPGRSVVPGTLVVTALWEDSDYFENHHGGMTWALSQHSDLVAIGVDITHEVDTLEPAGLAPVGTSYAFVLDGRPMPYAGWADDGGWQRAALEGFELHVVGPGTTWSP